MYSSIRINGYRGFDSFRMEGLGRVNLLVGTNNSGKTSILECIELLWSAGHRHVLSSIARRRGELGYTGYRLAGTSLTIEQTPVNVAHLFPSHRLEGEIIIEADCVDGVDAGGWNERVAVCVENPSRSELDERAEGMLEGDDDERLLLRVKWAAEEDYKALVTDDGLLYRSRRPVPPRNGPRQTVQFVRTSGMSASDVVGMFDRVVLTESDYESLGAAVESDVGDVTIQRVDRRRGKAVSITIVAAAERNVEVR